MCHRWVHGALAALALGILARPALACSLRAPWEIHDPSLIAFIGVPRADTVHAGPGAMHPVNAAGHSGPGASRTIYGQRVGVDQLGETARRALPDGVRDVVLVPWDYAADCRPVPYNRSARWLPDSARGLFRATLRARADWAEGMPTFDVLTTVHQPYRDGIAERNVGFPRIPQLRLSEQALLDFYDRLPAPRTTPDSLAALAFLRQLRADSTWRGRYPLRAFEWAAHSEIGEARRLALRIPIAGTFRVEAQLDSQPGMTFFLRTASRATTLQLGGRAGPASDSTGMPPAPEGYYVYTGAARTLAELPKSCHAQQGVLAYFDLDWHPPVATDGTGEWRGGFDPRLFEGMLSVEALARWRERQMAASRARSDSIRRWGDSIRAIGDSAAMRAAMNRPFEFVPHRPLRVAQGPTGPMRIAGTVTVAGLGDVRIIGERIAADTLACSH